MNRIPYDALGQELKAYRSRQLKTLEDVAGAVEIGQDQLARIEAGRERPDEEILLLLINHFDLPDDEADKLWEMAGYSFEDDAQPSDKVSVEQVVQDMLQGAAKPIMMMLSVETRSVYTNNVRVAADSAGLTMDFSQTNASGQSQVVARVGMSYEQAQQTLRELQKALLSRQLPPQN